MEHATSTTMPAAITILALDLGKFKSVACRYDSATGDHAFQTIATNPAAVHDLLIEAAPAVLVIEACGVCGWISDLAKSLSIEVRVANTLGEAWKWRRGQRTRRKQAAVALARKILIWCWAILRDGSVWDDTRDRRLAAT